MQTFKVEVSKGLKKSVIIRKAQSESELKNQLHKEGFSVLSISVVNDSGISGNKFYFEIFSDGKIKKGTIIGDDIFKAYLKIKNDLKYDLKYIYDNEDDSEEKKEKIMYELREKEKIYKEINKKVLEKQEKKQKEITKSDSNKEEKIENFSLKKDLEKVYNIIDKILGKIKFILENDETKKILDLERNTKLSDIYNSLIKLKNSNNLEKLKQISVIALKKIGEVELELVESRKNEETRELLKETNNLLKKLGSRDSFKEKEKDIVYILSNYLKNFKDSFKKEKKQKKVIDTTSSIYLKTKLLYSLYEKKKKKLQKEIYTKFYVLLIPTKKNLEIVEEYKLKISVINQNLAILKKRFTDETFSYVKLKKGYMYFIEKFLLFLDFLKQPLFIIIYLYSAIFIVLQLSVYYGYNLNLNFYGLFYFLFFIFSYFLLKHVKGLISLSVFVVFLGFIFIVGVINF